MISRINNTTIRAKPAPYPAPSAMFNTFFHLVSNKLCEKQKGGRAFCP
jgi:hypothetical protein